MRILLDMTDGTSPDETSDNTLAETTGETLDETTGEIIAGTRARLDDRDGPRARRGTSLDPSKDLRHLTVALHRRFRGRPPRGYLLGKTRIRNAMMDTFGFSALRAERLVDRMQSLGFLRYTGSRTALDQGRAPWRFEEKPSSLA